MFFFAQNRRKNSRRHFASFLFVTVGVAFSLLANNALAAKAKPAQFSSPEEAVAALVSALQENDENKLLTIFGPEGEQLISSGDEVADESGREHFLKMYTEKNLLLHESDKRVVLQVGNEDWPLPIPIVKEGKSWRFDIKEGKEELLNRRIGKNELSAIQVCLAYVEAQREYSEKDANGDGTMDYAMKLMSEEGKKDGLYWETQEGEEPSPLGPLMAKARNEGYSDKQSNEDPTPYYGYFYKILTAQGPHAPDGACDYVVQGKMIGGFALVAYPAQYGSSGVMTFIVNHDGIVYQKDLGPKTDSLAGAMEKFDPDKTWKKVEM